MQASSTSFPEVRDIVVQSLGIQDRADTLTEATPLLGGLPELDSLAVLEVITVLEERFGLDVDDLDITGEVFDTLGSLSRFVDEHRGS
jgi:acyl carrier protein